MEKGFAQTKIFLIAYYFKAVNIVTPCFQGIFDDGKHKFSQSLMYVPKAKHPPMEWESVEMFIGRMPYFHWLFREDSCLTSNLTFSHFQKCDVASISFLV